MQYVGSKRRISSDLIKILNRYRRRNQFYIEPFMGGANIIKHMEGKRIGNDVNKYLIALFDYYFKGGTLDRIYTLEKLKEIRDNREHYPDWEVGYIGFLHALIGFLSGFMTIGCKKELRRKRAFIRTADLLKANFAAERVFLTSECYSKMYLPPNSLIYCDPPYINTSSYKIAEDFNHEKFFEWAEEKTKEGHTVLISEQTVPKHFKCIYEKELTCRFFDKPPKTIYEKLFILE